MHAAEGFPRHYPSADVSSLTETAGVGFAVMSGCAHGIAPMQGNFLPDKEFRSAVLLLLSMSKSDKTSGLVISANLPMSPWGSDHIINSKAIYELVGVPWMACESSSIEQFPRSQ